MALKRSGPKTNLLINSPRGPRPVLQLAQSLLLEFPDQITDIKLFIFMFTILVLQQHILNIVKHSCSFGTCTKVHVMKSCEISLVR